MTLSAVKNLLENQENAKDLKALRIKKYDVNIWSEIREIKAGSRHFEPKNYKLMLVSEVTGYLIKIKTQ